MPSYSPTYTADVSVASVSELITEMNNATAGTIIDASNSDNNGLVPADTVIDGSGCLVFTNMGKNALLRCEQSNVEIRNATLIGANGDTFGPYSENSAIWIFNSDVHVENVRCRNWQGAGISVGHTSDTNRYTPTITDCDLIDNRSSGYGYGIGIYSGFPDISNCYFNGNKHQIACSGESNAGYEVYDSYFGDHYNIFGCDMHDPGGEKFLIHHNTLEFAHNKDGDIRHNVVMRGESAELSKIHHNWFYNPNAPPDTGDETGSVGDGSAIRQDTTSDTFVNLDVYDNHFGSSEPSDSTIGQRTGSNTAIQWGSHFDWDGAQTHDRVITSDIGVQRSDDLSQGWDIVDGVASDAVTYWTMDESSGDLIDVAGSLNATVYGATHGVTGPLRTNALSFDGIDDYAAANSSGDPTGGGDFSILAWVNKETVDNIDTILRSGSTTAGTFFFDYRSDTRIGCGFYDSSENAHYSTTFHDGATLAGTQHLVIATFDESAGEITVYLDGVADTVAVSATRPECTETVQIGRSTVENNPRYMTGDLGAIIVWGRALSSTEATTLTDTLSSGTLTTATKSGDGQASSVAIDCEIPSAIAGETTATVHNSNVESETVTLTEGHNDYSLANFTAIDGDFWIDYDLAASDATQSAEVYQSELTLTGSSLTPLGTVPIEVAGTSYNVPVYDRTELENSGRATGPGGTASNGNVGAFKLVNPSESKFHCTVKGTIYGIALSD